MIDEIGMLRSVYLTPSELTARVPEVGPQPYAVGNCGAREAESRQAGHTSKQSDLLRNNLFIGKCFNDKSRHCSLPIIVSLRFDRCL